MMGWSIFGAIASGAMLLLWRPGRLDAPTLTLVAAALFVAAAGYAWLGTPGEPGAPAAGRDKAMRSDTLFASERQQFLNKFGETGTVLATADAFNRMGEDETAADLLGNSIAKHPRDVDLRIGYAHALLVLARGTMTPAVVLAFDRAEQLAPASPAPRYFRGLAQLEIGDASTAEQTWRALDASLPTGSLWKAPLEKRLAIFAMMRAQAAGRP
jgi:cytochrome c-type biogenesis protein CcmH/NrfG